MIALGLNGSSPISVYTDSLYCTPSRGFFTKLGMTSRTICSFFFSKKRKPIGPYAPLAATTYATHRSHPPMN